MIRCTKCILPETFPSIKFDADGVCNYCLSYKGPEHQEELKLQYRQKFDSLLKNTVSCSLSPLAKLSPAAPSYDVLMAHSGGKDSTYTLDILKNHYKPNILALTFDHGFLSPFAKENIQTSLNRVMKYLSNAKTKSHQDITIAAKHHDKVALLKADEIYYFSAQLNDTIAKTKSGEYFTHKKISDFDTLTHSRQFVKVHRSCIVNTDKISYLESIEQGKYCIYFKDIDEVIYTSRSGAQQLRNIFHEMI